MNRLFVSIVPALRAAALVGCVVPVPVLAQAQGLSLVGRDTQMSGNFFVGFSTLSDSGNLSHSSTALTNSFGLELADDGGVNGFVGANPVSGTGSFISRQAFEVGALGLAAYGQAQAQVTTGQAYVSGTAQARSSLELTFSVAVETPFILQVALVNGGGNSPVIVRLAPLGAVSSSSWQFTSTGAFTTSGLLAPGSWTLYANASAVVSPSNLRMSSYEYVLQLAPVPEPQSWALLGGGVSVLLLFMQRRRRATRRR
jgi:hypothetical protein